MQSRKILKKFKDAAKSREQNLQFDDKFKHPLFDIKCLSTRAAPCLCVCTEAERNSEFVDEEHLEDEDDSLPDIDIEDDSEDSQHNTLYLSPQEPVENNNNSNNDNQFLNGKKKPHSKSICTTLPKLEVTASASKNITANNNKSKVFSQSEPWLKKNASNTLGLPDSDVDRRRSCPESMSRYELEFIKSKPSESDNKTSDALNTLVFLKGLRKNLKTKKSDFGEDFDIKKVDRNELFRLASEFSQNLNLMHKWLDEITRQIPPEPKYWKRFTQEYVKKVKSYSDQQVVQIAALTGVRLFLKNESSILKERCQLNMFKKEKDERFAKVLIDRFDTAKIDELLLDKSKAKKPPSIPNCGTPMPQTTCFPKIDSKTGK